MNTNYKKVSRPHIEMWPAWMSTTLSVVLCIACYAGLGYLGYIALDWLGHYIMEATSRIRP